MFVLNIPTLGDLSPEVTLVKEKWVTLKFVWHGTDIPNVNSCDVYINGKISSLKLPLLNKSTNGISYARFRSGARFTDENGMYIEYVKASME